MLAVAGGAPSDATAAAAPKLRGRPAVRDALVPINPVAATAARPVAAIRVVRGPLAPGPVARGRVAEHRLAPVPGAPAPVVPIRAAAAPPVVLVRLGLRLVPVPVVPV